MTPCNVFVFLIRLTKINEKYLLFACSQLNGTLNWSVRERNAIKMPPSCYRLSVELSSVLTDSSWYYWTVVDPTTIPNRMHRSHATQDLADRCDKLQLSLYFLSFSSLAAWKQTICVVALWPHGRLSSSSLMTHHCRWCRRATIEYPTNRGCIWSIPRTAASAVPSTAFRWSRCAYRSIDSRCSDANGIDDIVGTPASPHYSPMALCFHCSWRCWRCRRHCCHYYCLCEMSPIYHNSATIRCVSLPPICSVLCSPCTFWIRYCFAANCLFIHQNDGSIVHTHAHIQTHPRSTDTDKCTRACARTTHLTLI